MHEDISHTCEAAQELYQFLKGGIEPGVRTFSCCGHDQGGANIVIIWHSDVLGYLAYPIEIFRVAFDDR